MNTTPSKRSDFTVVQCRDAIAGFDHGTVAQAVVVMTSRDSQWIEKAANHPDFGRAMFWVQEWAKVERINTRREFRQRLKLINAIEAERHAQRRQIGMAVFITLGIAALLAVSVLHLTA